MLSLFKDQDKIWMESVSRTNQMMLIQEIDLGGRQFSTVGTFTINCGDFLQLWALFGSVVDYDYEKKKMTSKQAKLSMFSLKSLFVLRTLLKTIT